MSSQGYAVVASSLRRYIPAALTLGAGVVLSIVLFSLIREREQALTQAVFEREASIRVAAIQSGIDRSLEVVESIGGLYAASDKIERRDFRAFVQEPLSRHKDIQALEWVPRVKDSERASYEEAARVDGLDGFQFTERMVQGLMDRAPPQTEYFPVYYVEPLTGNESAMGFDLASSATRLEALERARDSGEIVATGRITLVQGTGEQSGYLIFRPVYRNGATHGTVQERRESLEGYALGVFRAGRMVEESLKEFPVAGIDFSVYDEASPPGERLLYYHQSRARGAAAPALGEERAQASEGLHLRAALDVPGRRWSLLFSPTPEFLAAQRTLRAWEVLAAVLMFTSLLVAYLLTELARTGKIERLATDLSKANKALERQITQRKRAEEALKSSAARLERSNRELEQFASVAAHDLQEPLRKVQTFGERLRAEAGPQLTAEGLDYLERMQDASGRMRTLIDDLLTFSRVTTKGEAFVPVDVTGVAREVVSDLEASLEEEGGRVEVGHLPHIDADPMQVRQLLQNLISNGLKFRRLDQAPVVKVRGRLLGGSGDRGDPASPVNGMCEITVEDNGIGFDEKYIDRIFTIFQRLHGRGEYEGTGIGLALCRKIAERHGGTITATSRPGQGSTFAVTLPVKRSSRQARE